jgi:hypothetical protein
MREASLVSGQVGGNRTAAIAVRPEADQRRAWGHRVQPRPAFEQFHIGRDPRGKLAKIARPRSDQ